jgi:hypothetical protein
MTQYDFKGLRANNLVAFLAALGTLRVSTHVWPDLDPKLAWSDQGDRWSAMLRLNNAVSQDEFLAKLHSFLVAQGGAPAINIADDLTIPTPKFHTTLDNARIKAGASGRTELDFLAAFGSDAVESKAGGKPSGNIADTAFRTMSGAGHQHFLGTMRTLIGDTTEQHLERALFTAWTYTDPMQNHSLRWDPNDDIRYALQWTEPSKDKDRQKMGSVWGAYRLAVEALPLFTTAPQADRLATTGFSDNHRDTQFTWPIWDQFIGLDTAASLVALAKLKCPSLDRAKLAKQGIQEIFRCRRITQGKFRNFTSARPV